VPIRFVSSPRRGRARAAGSCPAHLRRPVSFACRWVRAIRPFGSRNTIEAMSPPPEDRLRHEIDAVATQPYLLTVTPDRRPHCSCSAVEWNDGRLLTPAPGGWDQSDRREDEPVTLLWPPESPGGYSLIVDGTASPVVAEGRNMLAVTLTRGVLHRPARATDPAPETGCQSDCIQLFPG
jgi:hypothetical protein